MSSLEVLIPLKTGRGSNDLVIRDENGSIRLNPFENRAGFKPIPSYMNRMKEVLIPLKTGRGSNHFKIKMLLFKRVLIPLKTGRGSNLDASGAGTYGSSLNPFENRAGFKQHAPDEDGVIHVVLIPLKTGRGSNFGTAAKAETVNVLIPLKTGRGFTPCTGTTCNQGRS